MRDTRLSVRNAIKGCMVCNMGWMQIVDEQLRKAGLSEPQSRSVVMQLADFYRREKRYFR